VCVCFSPRAPKARAAKNRKIFGPARSAAFGGLRFARAKNFPVFRSTNINRIIQQTLFAPIQLKNTAKNCSAIFKFNRPKFWILGDQKRPTKKLTPRQPKLRLLLSQNAQFRPKTPIFELK